MRNLTFICVILFVSCKTNTNTKTISFKEKNAIDSIVFADSFLTVKTISHEAFNNLSLQAKNYSDIDTSLKVNKVNDTLKLSIDNGTPVVFVDTLKNSQGLNSNERTYYSYGFSELLNSYFVYVVCYEWQDYCMISRTDGQKIYILSYPEFSKSKNRFFCNGGSIAYTEQQNGIEFYDLKNKPNLRYNNELRDFQFLEPAWINDTLILSKVVVSKVNNQYDTLNCVVRLKK